MKKRNNLHNTTRPSTHATTAVITKHQCSSAAAHERSKYCSIPFHETLKSTNEESKVVELKRMMAEEKKLGCIEMINPLHSKLPVTQGNHAVDHGKTTKKISTKLRNSWADLKALNAASTLQSERRTILLLGDVSDLEPQTYWTIKYGQRLVGLFGVLAIIFFILNGATSLDGDDENIFFWISSTFGLFTVFCFLMVYYKNFSGKIFLRVCRELNVAVIILAGILNLFIEYFSSRNVYDVML